MVRQRGGVAATVRILLLVLAAAATEATLAASEQHQRRQRGLNALTDLPTTYGQYLPPWMTSADYGLTYSQTPSAPSWLDPAQEGINTPGWFKCVARMLQQRGILYTHCANPFLIERPTKKHTQIPTPVCGGNIRRALSRRALLHARRLGGPPSLVRAYI